MARRFLYAATFFGMMVMSSSASENSWVRNVSYSVHGNETMEVIIGLTQDLNHTAFVEMHTPGSETFRQFLSNQEIRSKIGETVKECSEIVKTTLSSLDLKNETTNGEYLSFEGTVNDINTVLFQGRLEFYKFSRENYSDIIRGVTTIEDIDLLDLIADNETRRCIGFIGRVSDFPIVKTMSISFSENTTDNNSSRLRSLSSCQKFVNDQSDQIVPEVLYEMYSIPDAVSVKVGDATVTNGIFEFQSAYSGGQEEEILVSPDDLNCFNDMFDLPAVSLHQYTQNGVTEVTSSCVDTPNQCVEPDLDVQYSSAANRNSQQRLGYFLFSDFSHFLLYVSEMSSTPITISISYTQNEGLESIHLCKEFANIAMSGTTVFASSGDRGATGGFNDCTAYVPSFPASCPYVTAVGATYGFKQGDESVCEGPTGVVTSGGGFSNLFTTDGNFDLSFQREAVSEYLAKLDDGQLSPSSAAGYNAKGRGYPDISAAGANYIIVNGVDINVVSGTSASSPVMAGFTSFASARVGERFGWINPLLYKNASNIFFDVTSGQNNCQELDATCCTDETGDILGFVATEGWDPATGLGTLGKEGAFLAYEASLSSIGTDLNLTDNPDTKDLSTGAIAGIVIASILGVVFITICGWYLCKSAETKTPPDSQQESGSADEVEKTNTEQGISRT